MEQDEHPDDRRRFLTVPGAARLLGVGERTIQAAIRSGQLPTYRLSEVWPYVRVADLEKWVASRRVQPDPQPRERRDESGPGESS